MRLKQLRARAIAKMLWTAAWAIATVVPQRPGGNMASIAEMSDRRMSIGRVFSRAFGTIGAQPALMFGIAFLFGALPSVLVNYAVQSTRITVATPFSATSIGLSVGVGLLAIAFAILAQGALVKVTVAHSDGHAVGFGDAAFAGLRKIVPLFVLALLIGIAVGFASLLLVVPGIILYVVWSAAAPALVAENTGIFGALGRSADLTRGARWNVFAVQLVMLLIYYTVAAIAGMIVVLAFGGLQNMVAARLQGPSILATVLSGGFNTLSITVAAAIQTALYVELRNWKDGPATAALGDIFG